MDLGLRNGQVGKTGLGLGMRNGWVWSYVKSTGLTLRKCWV